jgi:hypothetical protein
VALAARAHGTALAVLILALLVRLFGRTDAAWILLPPDDDYDDEYDEYPACTPYPYAILVPPVGRAPHAACIEAGLVPDWILPGIRNRGMRPAAIPTRRRPRARPARAPPSPNAVPR